MSRRVSDERISHWLSQLIAFAGSQYVDTWNGRLFRTLADLRDERIENTDLQAKLAAAEQQIAGAKREGMAEAAKIADAYANRPSVDAVRRAGAIEVAALIRKALPLAPSDAAEPGATEVLRERDEARKNVTELEMCVKHLIEERECESDRADALVAQLEADRVCKESLQTERDALAAQLAEKDALLREAEARCEAEMRKHEEDHVLKRGCNFKGRNIPECDWPHCPCKVYENPRSPSHRARLASPTIQATKLE